MDSDGSIRTLIVVVDEDVLRLATAPLVRRPIQFFFDSPVLLIRLDNRSRQGGAELGNSRVVEDGLELPLNRIDRLVIIVTCQLSVL